MVPGLLLILGALLHSSLAQATPAFARQMNMNCMGCHEQKVPMLNSFGRFFKLSGFTMTSGDISMIKGGDLGMSLPRAINIGAGIKSNILSTNQVKVKGKGANQTIEEVRDQISIPAGGSILIGGKIAENMGANSLWNADGIVHFQGTYSKPIGAARAGLSMFGTKGHGSFISVESHNTGLHKELAMFSNSTRSNAVQAMGMGLGKGAASGIVAFYATGGLNVAVGMTTLGYKNLDTNGKMGNMYRLTYDTTAVSGWDISLGAFGVNGTTSATSSKISLNFAKQVWGKDINNHEVTSNGFDLQASGTIAGLSTQIILTNVANYKFQIRNEADTQIMVNMDLSATSLEMQISPTAAWALRAGLMNVADNNNSKNDYSAINFGVHYNYTDNISFSLERSNIDNDTADDFSETLLTSLVLF